MPGPDPDRFPLPPIDPQDRLDALEYPRRPLAPPLGYRRDDPNNDDPLKELIYEVAGKIGLRAFAGARLEDLRRNIQKLEEIMILIPSEPTTEQTRVLVNQIMAIR